MFIVYCYLDFVQSSSCFYAPLSGCCIFVMHLSTVLYDDNKGILNMTAWQTVAYSSSRYCIELPE